MKPCHSLQHLFAMKMTKSHEDGEEPGCVNIAQGICDPLA